LDTVYNFIPSTIVLQKSIVKNFVYEIMGLHIVVCKSYIVF